MDVDSKEEQYERAYQRAMEIIDQEWLDAGMTRQELEQDKRLADLFDELLASGRSMDDIVAEWQGKSAAEILSQYTSTPVFPSTS